MEEETYLSCMRIESTVKKTEMLTRPKSVYTKGSNETISLDWKPPKEESSSETAGPGPNARVEYFQENR